MTAKQQSQVLAIIAKDCKVRLKFVNYYGTCVNGALALASGVPREKLERINNIALTGARFIRVAIKKKFGLTPGQLLDMQFLNDRVKSVKKRREELAHFVKAIRAK